MVLRGVRVCVCVRERERAYQGKSPSRRFLRNGKEKEVRRESRERRDTGKRRANGEQGGRGSGDV